MSENSKPKETLLLKQPTVSKTEIAFIYAGDLWIAGRDGSNPRRLTAQKGPKSSPYFSPDGEWIAFSASYDSGTGVYVISREGGSPRRLTYHPDVDAVRGWTPDGSRVLFASTLKSYHPRNPQLFTVPVEGGLPEALPMDMAFRGAYSPDGKKLAYTRFSEMFWTWKRYRGGTTPAIWVLDLESLDYEEIPHERATDTFPCWLGKDVYFVSDRNGITNLFRWTSGQGDVEQVTDHTEFDVRSLSAGPDCLAYEQAGRLHLYDPQTGKSQALHISINVEMPEARPHFRQVVSFIQDCGISPSGQRALFEARGEIFSVPAKKGDVRNLTQTPGAAERYPAWSPDGQSIAYFSDESGEYDLVISDQKGAKKTVIPLNRETFFYSPVWAPDSKKIAFTDKALNLYYIDLDSKEVTRVDTDTYDHPDRSLNPVWSPDSKWLAYTRRLDSHIRAVFLYELESGQAHQITDGMSDTTSACFGRDGKTLFFAASTNYGLNTGWLDMSSIERPVYRSLYMVVLNAEDKSPLAPESDDEEPKKDAEDAEGKEDGEGEKKEDGKDADKKKEEVPEVKIDLDGIQQRILSLPVPARNYVNLQAAEGKLFYMERHAPEVLSYEPGAYTLQAYDLKERKAEPFVDAMQGFWVSADGKKLLYRAAGKPAFAIVSVEKRPDPKDGVLDLSGLKMRVDPQAEWRQIYHEAYRIHRDFFYDAYYHGLDLKAAYEKYLPFLEHLGHRDDLNYLLSEFSGEMVSGHMNARMGDIPGPAGVSVGMLGADYSLDADGYYRIERILPGLNWHPELRSPLTEPGVNVKEGEYLLAVNGKPLRAPDNLYRAFENTAGKVTDLLVGETTDPETARLVTVKPLAGEQMLRHWHWVEGNRRKVDELTNGRVAYVYMPDTSLDGYSNFNRYYFSQLDKEAVVLDERFNGGGSVADYVIDNLNRPLLSYWATREGKVFTTPNASIFGPKVMIINELAGSGGDAMPHFFRRRGLGKLVGKRTWGGLIGIYDYPTLVDGGYFTSPRMAIYSPDGEWEVENVGVPPDVDVEMAPKQTAAGHDPQLEKAVEIALEELEKAPFNRQPRPAPIHRV